MSTEDPGIGRKRSRVGNYLSNVKWLVISLVSLRRDVQNWGEVLRYYLSPLKAGPLLIRFRNHETLLVPKDYPLEPTVETLVQNVYRFDLRLSGAIVDIGASVGDFVLLASRRAETRVYAYEKSREVFRFMELNVAANRRPNVKLFNLAANRRTLSMLLDSFGETEISFLKIDCEGCEYDLLMRCSSNVLSRIRRISMETHQVGGFDEATLSRHLERAGFKTGLTTRFGHGTYLLAQRP